MKGIYWPRVQKSLIETEYGITAKPITLIDPKSNEILDQKHQNLGNLVQNFNIQQTHVDENDPWTRILAAAAFGIFSTNKSQKCYIPGQLMFGRERINIELTMTIKSEINLCSITTLHTNMTRHIKAIL